MNHAEIAQNLAKLTARAEAQYGSDGSLLTEKRKKASDFLKKLAKKTGMKVSSDRDNLEAIGGYIRWHKAGAAAKKKAAGKKAKAKGK